jgi:hypothetical protein
VIIVRIEKKIRNKIGCYGLLWTVMLWNGMECYGRATTVIKLIFTNRALTSSKIEH